MQGAAGLNVLLCTFIVMYRARFLPAFRLFTGTLSQAWVPLKAFILSVGVMFVFFTYMAYLLFGGSIKGFSTIWGEFVLFFGDNTFGSKQMV